VAALYVDTSALVKLIVSESETGPLRVQLASRSLTSSELTVAELLRAVRRHAVDPTGRLEELALDSLSLIALHPVNHTLLMRAALMEPRGLRTLDAIHLATALELKPGLEAFVTYDRRLAGAARGAGLQVVAPR
jgi:predicted nucleic acid-binding protein